MALQAYGGPDITTFRVPVDGQSSKIGANLGVTLNYAFKDGGLTGRYFHGLTGGSGVFTGSTVDQVNFGANHALSRVWTGHLNFGYAHNTAIVSSTTASSQTTTVGFSAAELLVRSAETLLLRLPITRISAVLTQSGCTSGSCSSNQTTFNTIIINFQWHTRPFVLQ